MAKLELSQIQELIKSPENQKQIRKAINYENRLNLHTTPILSRSDFATAHFLFLDWVKNDLELSEEKFNTFNGLFKPPFQTVELIESIFSVISSIFEAKNPLFKFEFIREELNSDFEEFRNKSLKDIEFFKTKGLEAFKKNPNGFIVVDLPPVQTTEAPEPYFYFLSIENVVSVKQTTTTKRDNKIEYIIFKQKNDTFAAFDDEFLRTFNVDDNGEIISASITEVPHNLGFTPVKEFINTPINEKEEFIKSNPVTNSLTNLDLLLFFLIGKEHNNLYDFFPILWTYPEIKDYEHGIYTADEIEEIKEKFTEEGREDFVRRIEAGHKKVKKLRGAGSIIEKPMPEEGVPDIGEPIGRMKSDVNLLQHINEDLQKRKDNIFFAAVGQANTGEAMQSRTQRTATEIKSSFEGRKKILMQVKTTFEQIHKWTLETVIKYRYLPNQFVNSTINYGNDFFIFSLEELEESYKKAKEEGKPESEIINILQDIIETKYKNDPDRKERLKILLNLEPLPTSSIKEATELNKIGGLSNIDFQIKINFTNFIKRFERENGSLLVFGEFITFEEKIKRINESLKEYAEEKIKELPKPQPQAIEQNPTI